MAFFYKYEYTNKRKNIHPCLKINKSFLFSPFLLLTYDQQEQIYILLFAIKLIFGKQRSPCADRHSALNARHAQTVTGSPTDLIVDTWTPGSQ